MTTQVSEEEARSEETPTWFRQNVGVAAVSRFVEANGASIHYRQWGGDDEDKPGILLIHGGFAHSHWWDFIAPEFLDAYRVAALDCSGAGDSDAREVYSPADCVAEIAAVCRDAGFGKNAFLVGHSLGFVFALQATLHARAHYRGLIGIDPPGARPERDDAKLAPRAPRFYPTRSAAVARFRLTHPVHNEYLVAYIAERSVKQTEEGWTWKSDPHWRERGTSDGAIAPDFKRLAEEMGCPLALLLGRRSAYFSGGLLRRSEALLGRENVVQIEGAGHHVHLDQPLVAAREIKGILARW